MTKWMSAGDGDGAADGLGPEPAVDAEASRELLAEKTADLKTNFKVGVGPAFSGAKVLLGYRSALPALVPGALQPCAHTHELTLFASGE
jgi:hypothetical protein